MPVYYEVLRIAAEARATAGSPPDTIALSLDEYRDFVAELEPSMLVFQAESGPRAGDYLFMGIRIIPFDVLPKPRR